MYELEIKSITKNFNGLKAVNNLSFEINKGTITALIGPNGSGKTTVFNVITGLYIPQSGAICFKGEDIVGLSTYRIAQMGIGRSSNKTIKYNLKSHDKKNNI